MPKFEKVNIGEVTDLPTFYDNLENIFVGDYGFSEYKQGKYCTQGYYGRVFGKKDLKIWIGICLYNGKIWIAFKKDVKKDGVEWTPEGILKKLGELCTDERSGYYPDEDELSGFVYWFVMEDDKILRGENADAAAQKKALKDFIRGVFGDIGASGYLK
jgi:hypothetical protein